MDEIWSWIFQSYGGWQYDDSNQTNLPEAYTDLVASQSKYGLASEMLTVNRVEVTDAGGGIRRLVPVPQEQIEGVGISQFTPPLYGRPQFYRLSDGIIELIPAPPESVTGGLTIYFERAGVAFVSTDTTAQPGFASPFHRLVPIGASIAWYKNKSPKSETLKELKEDWAKGEDDLRQFYTQRWRDYRPKLNPPLVDWQ